MDRERANQSIRTALLIGAFAILVFALTFFVSVLYV